MTSKKETRSGTYYKANSAKGSYMYFVPKNLPHDIKYNEQLVYLISKAMLKLMELDRKISSLASSNPITILYLSREATLSSQIEGTYATLQQALELEAGIEDSQRPKDAILVLNYKRAFWSGVKSLNEIGLTNRLIKSVHGILWENVPSQLKPDPTPGEFRTWQNCIGGVDLVTATYVPPPPTDMQKSMSSLERFINKNDKIDLLVKTAIIHAQFEAIHPFGDGNGRVGRLINMFFLIEKKVINAPILYLSYFFKKNLKEYNTLLQGVHDGNWEAWIEFFLKGIIETAENAIKTANELNDLEQKMIDKITAEFGKNNGSAFQLLFQLFSHPIVTVKDVEEITGRSKPYANNLVDKFVELEILTLRPNKATSNQRGRKFVFKPLFVFFDTWKKQEA